MRCCFGAFPSIDMNSICVTTFRLASQFTFDVDLTATMDIYGNRTALSSSDDQVCSTVAVHVLFVVHDQNIVRTLKSRPQGALTRFLPM